MVIAQKTNDLMWKMDQILNNILGTKYPNDASVYNDRLRSTLTDAFGFNLNMFDTHQFAFSGYNGIITTPTYYIYEAPMDKIKTICGDKEGDYGEYFINNVVGDYPEGTVLGFFATEFRDPEYIKEHKRDYAEFLYIAMSLIRDRARTVSAYDWYIDALDVIYIFKRFNDLGVTLNYMGDLGYNCILFARSDGVVDIAGHVDAVKAIIYNKEDFMKACNSYNFATIYKFFLDHNAINGEFINKDLYDIGVIKKYKPSEDGFTMQEIRPEDKEFFDESYNAMTIVPASSTDSVSYNIDMPEGDSEEIKDKE